MTALAQVQSGFVTALLARERSPEIPESADIYGRFLGSWEIEVYDYHSDGSVRRSSGEVHFERVLEGRAMQLVWAIPQRSERDAQLSKDGNRYGTTLCVWDASAQGWRVTWINPVTGVRTELLGREIDGTIVQIGRHADGVPVRWNFNDVTRDAFRWTGEALEPDGRTWRLEVEFRARRLEAKER